MIFPVTEDKNSPAAISGSGCTCRRAFYDPEFGLPVVGEHFKHAGTGGTDQWSYTTYAPRALRPDHIFSSFITGRGLFWARTDKGLLSILPQKHAVGYDIGYRGGGPHALAAYLTQVARNDGGTTPAGTPYEEAHPAIVAWTPSSAADRGTNELTLSDLQVMSVFQPVCWIRVLRAWVVCGRGEAPGRRVGVESKPSCQELPRACLPSRRRSVHLHPALPRP